MIPSRSSHMAWLLFVTAAGAVTAGSYLTVTVLTFGDGSAAWADEQTPMWLAALQNVIFFVSVLIPIVVGVASLWLKPSLRRAL